MQRQLEEQHLDWLMQLATLQMCYPDIYVDEAADKLARKEPLTTEENEALAGWARCIADTAFQPPLPEIFGLLAKELEKRIAGEEAYGLLARYQELVETHKADPCTDLIWLARRTSRFMDRPTLTLKQYQKLTGNRHPGMANILPGNLVPWEIAVDEKADELKMTSDELEKAILLAYDREKEIFSLLAELKAQAKGGGQR